MDTGIQSNTSNKFIFEKSKMLGGLRYLHILTELVIKEDTLHIDEKKKWFSLFKGQHTTSSINLSDINSVSLRNTWDFWDCVYGVIAGYFGLAKSFFLLIFAALFFHSAYGKKIEISTKQNLKINIRLDHADNVHELLKIISPNKY